MSFSDAWLALREPADHRAADGQIIGALINWVEDRVSQSSAPLRILDLGCGTGSNLRGLSPHLPAQQSWTLVDQDPALHNAARTRLKAWSEATSAEDVGSDGLRLEVRGRTVDVTFQQADLAQADLAELVTDVDLVTASALFDLCSSEWILALKDAVFVRDGRALFARLSYDGQETWLPPHPADADILAAFARDQRTDKGFGEAAGPDAWDVLADTSTISDPLFSSVGETPWTLKSPRDSELIAALADGIATAAERQGIDADTVADWRSSRVAADTVEVGHKDVLLLSVA